MRTVELHAKCLQVRSASVQLPSGEKVLMTEAVVQDQLLREGKKPTVTSVGKKVRCIDINMNIHVYIYMTYIYIHLYIYEVLPSFDMS